MGARAGHRRFWWLSALRAHANAPYKHDSLWETLRLRPRAGADRLQEALRPDVDLQQERRQVAFSTPIITH
jgi:hypothetical protein